MANTQVNAEFPAFVCRITSGNALIVIGKSLVNTDVYDWCSSSVYFEIQLVYTYQNNSTRAFWMITKYCQNVPSMSVTILSI